MEIQTSLDHKTFELKVKERENREFWIGIINALFIASFGILALVSSAWILLVLVVFYAALLIIVKSYQISQSNRNIIILSKMLEDVKKAVEKKEEVGVV